MRIRKQIRKVFAGDFPPGDFPLTNILNRGDWTSQVSSKIGNEGTDLIEKSGLDFQADSRHQPAAAVAGNVEPGRDASKVVGPESLSGPQQKHEATEGFDEAGGLMEQVQLQEICKMPGVRYGRKQSPMSGVITSHSISEAEHCCARTHSSAQTADTGMTKDFRAISMKVSDSGSLGNSQLEDEHITRHYVRRSLQKSGDGTSQLQSDERFFPNEEEVAASLVHKTGVHLYNQSDSGHLNHLSEKSEPPSPDATWNNNLLVAESQHDNVDDDHPSREPEGSLLHTLYLQLVAAGGEGIALEEIYTSFTTQTSLPRFASNWRREVKAHLKKNPYFDEVKGLYFLCEYLVQPSSKRSAKRNDTSLGHSYNMRVKLGLNEKFISQPDSYVLSMAHPSSSSSLSNDNQEGVQTRRKAYQKTFEAVLSESAMEFKRIQQEKINSGGMDRENITLTESEAPHTVIEEPVGSQPKPTLLRLPKKRKSLTDEEELHARNIRFGGATPGSLKAMQARITAEYGVQNGVRCARKDGSNDSSKWQCPMMAMEGRTLCEHHNFLNERKKARYAKAKKQGRSKARQSLDMMMRGVDTGVSEIYLTGDVPCMSTPGPEISKMNTEEFTVLDEVASQALLNMKSGVSVGNFQDETHANGNHAEVTTETMNEQQNRNDEKLVPHIVRSATKSVYVAAKKTAVRSPQIPVEEKLKEKHTTPLIRPPTIPPLPALYGMRRKTVKNRSLLSL